MTDEELNILENKTKSTMYIVDINPKEMLDMIAELKQVRKERDWLISQLTSITNTNKGAWLEVAKEATK